MKKKIIFTGIAGLVVLLFAAGAWILAALSGLPDITLLKRYRPATH